MQPIRVPQFDVEAGGGTLHVTRPAEWDQVWKVYGEFPWTTVDIRLRGEFDDIRRAVDGLAAHLSDCMGLYEQTVEQAQERTVRAIDETRSALT